MALNFKPELLAKVLDESKTVTRRAWPTKYRAGQVVAVTPGMGRVAAGRVRIVDVQASGLALDADEARREGGSAHLPSSPRTGSVYTARRPATTSSRGSSSS